MITHEEARFEVGLCISAYDMNERLNAEQELYKYISQQEKKEKLLELLLKLDDCSNFAETRLFYEEHSEDIQILRKELEALK